MASYEDYDNCSRQELISVIETQRERIEKDRTRIQELESSLVIKGWWCYYCDIFNAEEKEPRVDCRSCGKSKKARMPPK